MRNTDHRRATYYQSRQKALAQADNPLAVEAVRLQAEAVATVTDWPEFQELADEAIEKEKELESHGKGESRSRIPPADVSDVNHE
ncbi:hypothetical protein [Salinisphaera sp.]|uniref:hypothetical protein n=1 Tax=Salinisphaera sp. TaxID=1914330 RepID=UPI000C395F72|nr:hypothetical protein [Salinisphaera sp.]MAS08644.1 hypothetical protein [Salinisphaera sp.]|tara:strand:- start:1076 stop:1330 length:255 start_codon:yes stop_codon:yes gene_type:complete